MDKFPVFSDNDQATVLAAKQLITALDSARTTVLTELRKSLPEIGASLKDPETVITFGGNVAKFDNQLVVMADYLRMGVATYEKKHGVVNPPPIFIGAPQFTTPIAPTPAAQPATNGVSTLVIETASKKPATNPTAELENLLNTLNKNAKKDISKENGDSSGGGL